MNWNKWIRQFHRWLSITFTLFVIANFAVMGREKIALWVGFLTLLPLVLLLLTGLYMFALPYVARWRNRGRTDGQRDEPTRQSADLVSDDVNPAVSSEQ